MKTFIEILNESSKLSNIGQDKIDKIINKYSNFFQSIMSGTSKQSFKNIKSSIEKEIDNINKNDKIKPQDKFSTQLKQKTIDTLEDIYKKRINTYVKNILKGEPKFKEQFRKELLNTMDLTSVNTEKIRKILMNPK